jgi:beta-RFAP synthase
MPRTVHVTAPSRLHFGLWSLAGGAGRQYGGVGAMVAKPSLSLRIVAATALAASGPSSARAMQFAHRWAEFHRRDLPLCRIETLSAPPQHAGLGSGTQLGLAIAASLSAFVGLPSQSPTELAASVGRGLRSAVGTYGFAQGGIIVEQGKLPGEPISPLDCRIDMPAQWRFMLVRPTNLLGLSGDDEATAIASLPPVATESSERLIAEVRDHLVPAAATGDFDAFAASLFRYGHDAGLLFAARQGGAYNGQVLTGLIDRLRSLGAVGAGQSSWGPTLYAVQPSQAAAEMLAARLRESIDSADLEIVITPPANRGACVEVTQPAHGRVEH